MGCGCGGAPQQWIPARDAQQAAEQGPLADPNERIQQAQHEPVRDVWPATWNGGPRETART